MIITPTTGSLFHPLGLFLIPSGGFSFGWEFYYYKNPSSPPVICPTTEGNPLHLHGDRQSRNFIATSLILSHLVTDRLGIRHIKT